MPYKDPAKQKQYQQKHYIANKPAYKRARDQSLRKLKDMVRTLKASTPCHDCGHKWHPCQMQFDHMAGHKKMGSISELTKQRGHRFVVDEIPKCQLVCANCHAMRTWRRIIENQ